MADFGPLGGVKIGGFISPTDTNDTYAVIDPIYGIGGFRVLTGSTSELDNIPTPRRRAGMVVGVSGGTAYYKLKPEPWVNAFSDWELFQTGGAVTADTYTTGTTLIGNIIYYDTNKQLSAYTADLSAITSTLTLSGLTDTQITGTPVNADIIIYDNGQWVNKEEKIIYFSPTGSSQTIFTNVISELPLNVSKTILYVNGHKQEYPADYTLVGTTLTWIEIKFNLDVNDSLELRYL